MPKKTAADIRQDEIQIANDNWKAYQRAYDSGHQTYVQEAVKFNKYYLGDQWDDADIKKLEAEGRPHLTINLILKIINAFLGEQRKQRADLAFKPNRDASHDMAVLMSKLVEQILDHNSYEFVEREVFSDGLIQDRG